MAYLNPETPEQFVERFFDGKTAPISPRVVTGAVKYPMLKDEIRVVLMKKIAEGSLISGADHLLVRTPRQ
jgi:hypothetical protein